MTAPSRTLLFHFTDISHVGTIVRDGLQANRRVGTRLQREAGQPGIKSRRDERVVPINPGGVVGDYVPFYFAPRSPMLNAIHHGRVPSYGSDTSQLVYLVSSVEEVIALGSATVFTNRNAALDTAEFLDDPAQLGTHVDWAVMRAQYWNNTAEDPDRRERRMAEFLVHGQVPWSAVLGIATYDEDGRQALLQRLASLEAHVEVACKRDWYF